MKVGNDDVSFHWKNYTRPTPANLERLAGAIRDVLAGAAGMSVANSFPDWLSASLAFSILLVGQAVKFFSSVKEQEENKPPVA